MARDLHDEMGPMLNAVKYNLAGFEMDDPEDKKIMEQSTHLLDTCIDRMRQISGNLMPESLLQRGLVEAVAQSISTGHTKNKLEIKLSHGNVPELKPEKAINIYRIIQEILSNTIRHAAARRLAIDIQSDEKTLILVTEDDGQGFDYPAEEKDFSGLGLRNLLSRTEMLKGDMYLETKAGSGTRYRFVIPV
jgi:signal transduction histidine kinase